MTHTASQLHVWYLCKEVKALLDCERHGIRKWGQLSSYLAAGAQIEDLEDKNILQKKISVLDQFQQLYRRGRPIPIDRSVLMECPAISERYIDKVDEVLTHCHGNPADLVRALKNKAVTGFRADKTIELETFFIANRYMDEEEPIEDEEILLQLSALISTMDTHEDEVNAFMQRVLARK